MSTFRFSIVMLLPDARGLAERSVCSWVTDQDFAREQFELIVVSNGCEPDVDVRITPLLGVSDRLLQFPNATRTELYDRGARAARGEFIVFTESHCLAEPTFLRAMDLFLRDTGLSGATCLARPICHDALGRLEARSTEFGLELYLRSNDWRKMNVHAFALRRDVYLEVGGMSPRYGIFAEMLLAAELWRRGHHVGVADKPSIGHLYDGHTREVRDYNADAVAGEIRYYRDHPCGPRVEHTYLADGDVPWSERELAWTAFAAMWAERSRDLLRPALRQGWRVLKLIVREGRLGRTVDHVTILLASAACRIIGEKPAIADRLFLKMWTTAARLARKDYLATEPSQTPASTAVSLRIDELPECDLWGFHLPERWQGEPLRWTGRCAVIRFSRPADACELILHTNGVGWRIGPRTGSLPAENEERACAFFVDDRRLPSSAITFEPLCIRLQLEATTAPNFTVIAVVCDAVKPEASGDSRELGFPLFRVESRSLGAVQIRVAA